MVTPADIYDTVPIMKVFHMYKFTKIWDPKDGYIKEEHLAN